MTLTPKQQRFCEEYIVDLNATQAAIRSGYSEKTACAIGLENLGKPMIQALIQEAMYIRSQRTEITADMVVRELALIGFADMADYSAWSKDGVSLIDSKELPAGASRAVAEVSQTVTKDGGTVKFKLHDKKAALELLGRHLNMFGDVGSTVVPMDSLSVSIK